jgi:hypothetical protein
MAWWMEFKVHLIFPGHRDVNQDLDVTPEAIESLSVSGLKVAYSNVKRGRRK